MNAGLDWTPIVDRGDFDNDYYAIIFKLIIDPNNSKVLYAATSKGVYRTLDCEVDSPIWERKLPGFTYDIELKPDNSNIIYSSTYNDATGCWRLMKSIDQGSYWIDLQSQPDLLTEKDVKDNYFTIEVSKAKPNYLYCTSRKNGLNTLYYSDLSGSSQWNLIGTFDNRRFGGGHGFGVDQVVDGEKIIVSNLTKVKGYNLDGSTFFVGGPAHIDVEDVIFHPYYANEVWSCTHGGVEKSVNGGAVWEQKYEGLGVAMVEKMATSYTSPDHILIGLYHDGTHKTISDYAPDWNPEWKFITGGDGTRPLIDNKDPLNMWSSYNGGQWQYSDDGFDHNYQFIPTQGIYPSAYWQSTGVLNKIYPAIFFRNRFHTTQVEQEEVFRSSNRGLNNNGDENVYISTFRNVLPNAYHNNILGLATPYNNENYLMAFLISKIDDNNKTWHVFRTTNANAPKDEVIWKDLLIPRTDITISAIEFDPENPDIIYLSYTHPLNNNNPSGLIYRIDYTNSTSPLIIDITKNLPATVARESCIAVERGSNGGVYLATEFGVFYTNNELQNNSENEWQLVGTDLPHLAINGMELNYLSNRLRVGTWGRGVWEIDLPCVNNTEPVVISQNTTWDSYMRLDRSVKVNYLTTLTINENARIAMPTNAKIIVEQGGKLIVNGGIITSGCDSPWQGIEVWGNGEATQWPNSNGVYTQGYVELNNATIENAICALDLWKPGDYTKTGGIVFANNTDFRNNRESVHALYYENHHPVNGKPMDYQAVFTNCTFNITDAYNPEYQFFKHIDLNQVNGVRFNGCDFGISPTAPGVSTYNQAIASYSAGFKVNAICEEYSQDGCVKYDPCTFTGFRTAIEASNTSDLLNTFYVNRAEFYDNSNGISVNSVKFPVIINSDFHLSNNQFSTEPCSYGVFLNRSIGFGIEENEFFKTTGAPQADYLGIGVVNCPTVAEIYKNELTGLSAGNYAFGKNWGDEIYKGLSYSCNINAGNFADFYVTGIEGLATQGIQSKQGSTAMPAGNEFSPSGASWNFFNSTKNLIGYYYCSSCPNQYPTLVENVTREPVNVINPCSSHYGGTTGRSIVMDAQQKLDTEIAFASAASNCNNVESLYNSLKDGGSTNVKVSEISSATAADMWTLRAGLLGDSPHLSEEVLKLVSDKTDVFTEAAIFDILAANPDELKKEELIKYLEEKENPLPTYMIDILKQVAEGTTYKTVLQQEISRYSHNKVRAANDMIRSILNDEVIDVSLLRNWLDNLGGIEADKQIISTYLQENNFTSAFALANLLPQLYNLLGDELAEHNRYINLLQLQQTLFTQGRTMAQLTNSEQEMLNEFALTGQGGTAAQAKAILEAFYDQHFSKCESLQGTASYKNHPINANQLGEAYGLSITVKPNPAADFTAFDYTLPNEETNAVLVISNSQGVIVETLNLNGNKGQKLWDTRSISSGSYIYTLKVAGFTKSGKLVIAN